MADEMSQDDIDALLGSATEARLGPAQPVALAALAADQPPADPASINMLYDVELEVKIELGRTMLSVEDILRLREGRTRARLWTFTSTTVLWPRARFWF